MVMYTIFETNESIILHYIKTIHKSNQTLAETFTFSKLTQILKSFDYNPSLQFIENNIHS